MRRFTKTLVIAVSLALLMILLTSAPPFDRYRFYRTPERAEIAFETVSLPAEISCGMLFVSTSINGNSPEWFLLDTGAGILILDSRDYPRDALSRSHLSFQYSGMGLLQGWKPTGPLDELRIGDTRFNRISAVFLPDDNIFAKLEGGETLTVRASTGIALNWHVVRQTTGEDHSASTKVVRTVICANGTAFYTRRILSDLFRI